MRALLRRFQRKGQAPRQPPVSRRLAIERADRPLAARADQDRAAETVKQRETVHQLEIVRDRSTKETFDPALKVNARIKQVGMQNGFWWVFKKDGRFTPD